LQAGEKGHSQTPDDASPSTGSNIVETLAMADKALASAKLEFDLLTSQRDATFVVGIFGFACMRVSGFDCVLQYIYMLHTYVNMHINVFMDIAFITSRNFL